MEFRGIAAVLLPGPHEPRFAAWPAFGGGVLAGFMSPVEASQQEDRNGFEDRGYS